MTTHATHHCSLCGFRFDGENCRGACPMSAGCEMVRCPRCGYEFVETGVVARLVQRWLDRRRSERSPS